jgi:hypothetical protein
MEVGAKEESRLAAADSFSATIPTLDTLIRGLPDRRGSFRLGAGPIDFAAVI